MKLIKEPTYILVCRSAFCVHCWQQERPVKGNKFLVYGTDTQNFKKKIAHQGGIKGFTPHLYTIQIPYKKTEEGLILAVKVCLIDGCGIDIGKIESNGNFQFRFSFAETVALTTASVEALITLWRSRTGYELL